MAASSRSPEAQPRRPARRFTEVSCHDRELVLSFIDALVTKIRLEALADGTS
jgi:hypothetical protein